MENNTSENKMMIPAAIVVAGLIIAGAIMYVSGPRVAPSPLAPPQGANNPPPSGNTAEILKIKKDDFVMGNPSAKVAIIEYGDFQCPFCGRFFSTTGKQIIDAYVKTGKAVFVWRDFAFLGEESYKSAEASRCAGEQGKFWEYHDYLFSHQNGENQGAFSDANLKKFASTLKLDISAFNKCFDTGKYKSAVTQTTEGGRSVGVSGTPATFVGTQLISGAVAFDAFKTAIEAALK